MLPTHDHRGAPLVGDRAAAAGQPIARSFRFLLTQFMSDWKFFTDIPQPDCDYQHTSVCHKCCATKCIGPCCAYDFNNDAPWTRRRLGTRP